MPLTVESLPPDSRGEIHRLDLNGVKVNLLFSKAGSLRGGDIHPNTQHGLVLHGMVGVTIPNTIGTTLYSDGMRIFVPPGVPHLYEYCMDTVQLEWWDGPFEATYYKPYRDRVEASLKGGRA